MLKTSSSRLARGKAGKAGRRVWYRRRGVCAGVTAVLGAVVVSALVHHNLVARRAEDLGLPDFVRVVPRSTCPKPTGTVQTSPLVAAEHLFRTWLARLPGIRSGKRQRPAHVALAAVGQLSDKDRCIFLFEYVPGKGMWHEQPTTHCTYNPDLLIRLQLYTEWLRVAMRDRQRSRKVRSPQHDKTFYHPFHFYVDITDAHRHSPELAQALGAPILVQSKWSGDNYSIPIPDSHMAAGQLLYTGHRLSRALVPLASRRRWTQTSCGLRRRSQTGCWPQSHSTRDPFCFACRPTYATSNCTVHCPPEMFPIYGPDFHVRGLRPWRQRKDALAYRACCHPTIDTRSIDPNSYVYPRADLCRYVRSASNQKLFNVSMSLCEMQQLCELQKDQKANPFTQFCEDCGSCPPVTPAEGTLFKFQMAGHRYLADVDGFAAAFDGKYWKLRSGSTVFSILPEDAASSMPLELHQQWYSLLLQDGQHYFRTTARGLGQKLAWCRQHEEACMKVGAAGQQLAECVVTTTAAIEYTYLVMKHIHDLAVAAAAAPAV